MNWIGFTFFVVNAIVLLAAPRRWAPLPLLLSCCYMTIGQGIALGIFSLPIYRMTLAIGLLRVVVRKESLVGGVNRIDRLMIVWSIWVVIASLFHEWEPGSGPVYASGFVFNIAVVYFLIRTWCENIDQLADLTKLLAFLLVPIALELIWEHIHRTNLFSIFGGVEEAAYIRDGKVRAQGPFRHPILTGTVGAVCFPLMVAIWNRYRRASLVGMITCLAIVFASNSSGPLMSLMLSVSALGMWRFRHLTRLIRFGAVGVYLMLELTMSRPAYFIISKIDLTGSSTGWHRSRLIQAAIEDLGAWWLLGTDLTIHWIGIAGPSDKHSDITNYYLMMGIVAGLPAMFLLIAIIWLAFCWVGRAIRSMPREMSDDKFIIWCWGASLFAHATTSISVAYFDQSVFFFWMNIAVISSMFSILVTQPHGATRAIVDYRQKLSNSQPSPSSSLAFH